MIESVFQQAPFDEKLDDEIIEKIGKEYLDFAAGIAVCSLGYGNETYTESLKNQVGQK